MGPVELFFLLLTPALYLIMLAAECLWPARPFPARPGWQWVGVGFHQLQHSVQRVDYHNFADLPVWDILFGTFRNPASYPGDCGFEDGRDRRISAMLLFADVNAEPYGAGNRGVRPANPA
jgi:sterol desaturase/sphingolipid hydroxylase (fatty acid hydroxylase superfamily)